ncbi:MAG: protein kinase [Deltaproteobacteria bacterium]|nr:protein kinase [Deltaproteobacteria bacterium]
MFIALLVFSQSIWAGLDLLLPTERRTATIGEDSANTGLPHQNPQKNLQEPDLGLDPALKAYDLESAYQEWLELNQKVEANTPLDAKSQNLWERLARFYLDYSEPAILPRPSDNSAYQAPIWTAPAAGGGAASSSTESHVQSMQRALGITIQILLNDFNYTKSDLSALLDPKRLHLADRNYVMNTMSRIASISICAAFERADLSERIEQIAKTHTFVPFTYVQIIFSPITILNALFLTARYFDSSAEDKVPHDEAFAVCLAISATVLERGAFPNAKKFSRFEQQQQLFNDIDFLAIFPPEAIRMFWEESIHGAQIIFGITEYSWPTISEDWHRKKLIGSGTFSQVFRLESQTSNSLIAVKRYKPDSQDTFLVETAALSLLHSRDCSHIAKPTGTFQDTVDKRYMLALEYYPNSLTSVLRSRVSMGEIKKIIRQLLLAISNLHAIGLLHCDIKPDNILLNNSGDVHLADFGSAEPDNQRIAIYRRVHELVTLWYRAPELLLRTNSYGAGIDIWSVGCILAELVLNRPIFQGRNEAETLLNQLRVLGVPQDGMLPNMNSETFRHARSSLQKARGESTRRADLEQRLGSVGMNFLLALLNLDPKQRLTAEQALKHPFLRSLSTQ